MRIAALVLSCSVLAFAQSAYEIRGTVLETGTTRGIDDATVRINSSTGSGAQFKSTEVARLVTDPNGAFVFHPQAPGEYTIVVAKPGYSPKPIITPLGTFTNSVRVFVTATAPRDSLTLEMGRLTPVTGRLIDRETSAPLRNFSLALQMAGASDGRRFVFNTINLKTSSDGSFSANVQPGRYVLETGPQAAPKWIGVQAPPDDFDIATDLDYPRVYYPGGADLNSALPFTLTSGIPLDLGTFQLRKEPFPRILLTLEGQCPSEEKIRVFASTPRSMGPAAFMNLAGTFSCGHFLLHNAEPGRYLFNASVPASKAEVHAAAQFDLRDRSQRVSLNFAEGFSLDTRVSVAEGASMDLSDLTLSVAGRSVPVPISRRLTIPNLRPGPVELKLFGTPNVYATRIRYNGLLSNSGIFNVNGPGTLEIEVDNQLASLTGTVRSGDKPVPGAAVSILRWPQPPLVIPDVLHLTADAAGNFSLSTLEPGTYKLLAVTAADQQESAEPAIWPDLVQKAQIMEFARGEAKTITLRPSVVH